MKTGGSSNKIGLLHQQIVFTTQ